MFVYSGKLTWRSSAKNETFVVVFPNGPVRTGDSVYLFSQWTKDSDGVEKKNWFENLIVDKVKKSSNGEDTFTLTTSWFTFTMTVQKAYDSLTVTMAHHHWYPSLFSETMRLERIWQPADQHPTGSTRIWTGKIKWREFAKNEMAMFILPDGVGEGKPVLSVWQWTKSSAGKEKDFQFRNAVQKMQPVSSTDTVKFSFSSYYDINCSWNQKTEKLAVNMKENQYSEDIGEMSLSVHINRHSHSFYPPHPASLKRSEFEVKLPQAQPSLPRILTPLPFPDSIVETLAQTVAFADHAGYLAKYAQDRFNALDADFHSRGQQLDTFKTQKARLDDTIKQLGGKLSAEETKATNLAKSLADAQAAAKHKEDELNKTIHGLEDRLAKDAQNEKEDHDIIEKTRKDLQAEKAHVAKLHQQLEKTKVDGSVTETRLKTSMAEVISVQGKLHELQTKYDVEKKHNEKLHAENSHLHKEKHDFADKLHQMQLKFDEVNKLYQKAQNDLKAKDDLLLKEKTKVTQLEKQRDAVTNERNAAVKERDAAKTEVVTNLNLYKDTVKVKEQLEISLKADKDKLARVEKERDAVTKERDTAAKERDAVKTESVANLGLYKDTVKIKDQLQSELKSEKDRIAQLEKERNDAIKLAKTNERLYKATKNDVLEARTELERERGKSKQLEIFRDEYEELLIKHDIDYREFTAALPLTAATA